MNIVIKQEKATMSNNDFMLDVGLANELKLAFRRTGYTCAEVKHLCERDILADIHRVLTGQAHIIDFSKENLIDCSGEPFTHQSFKVKSHKQGSSFVWNKTTCTSNLHRFLTQKMKHGITGYDFFKKLEKMPTANTCVLKYLLEHQEDIPESWKDKFVFFFGTIYYDPENGDQYVLCLNFYSPCGGDPGGWKWGAHRLLDNFNLHCYALTMS